MANRVLPLLRDEHYTLAPGSTTEEFSLLPPNPTHPTLHFTFIRDEMSRALLFMGDNADVLFDTLSLSKTNWMKNRKKARTIEAPGYSLSLLGFQNQDPILKDEHVRRAISLALPIATWIQYKFFNWVSAIPETPAKPDLVEARALLESAGFPIKENQSRFTLHYVTTPVREGNELAFLVREALKQVQIDVEIIPLETSLYFDRLKRGEFQLAAFRFFRGSPTDPISDYLAPHALRNYFRYEGISQKAPFGWDEVKESILRDLPLVPLFVWKHAAVLSDRIDYPTGIESKIDDSFRFLSLLTLK